jgi:predicted patatin/cPLA2 family phospholipase
MNAANVSPRRIRQVVFAGGGNRCFWQAGFWGVAAPTLGIRPQLVVAVSAGSAMACTLFSGTFTPAFARYKRAIANNPRNVYLKNIVGSRSVFPHGLMYRDAILEGIDAKALWRLHSGPQIHVLLSRPPRWASSMLSMLLGALAAGLDVLRSEKLHASAGAQMGFVPWYVPVQACATPTELADLIVASSCVPPLTPRKAYQGIVPLDGGLVSNVPVDSCDDLHGNTLVLLTRPCAQVPTVAGRIYAQPSQTVPVGAWDYTNSDALQATYDLGRRDAEKFCQKWMRTA